MVKTMKYKLKAFSDYGMPVHYVDVIKGYFTDSKDLLGNNMLMFMVTGSCALGSCLDEFSDIDVMVVVRKFDYVSLKEMHGIVEKYPIRIALTMFSQHEIESEMLDGKTYNFLFQLGRGMISPNYLSENLDLPEINLEALQKNDEKSLPDKLFRLKRLLYVPSNDKHDIIKMLYLVIKIRLRSRGHGIIATSYKEAFDKFATEFNAPSFNISAELNFGQPATADFITYARDVVERICNGKI
jgi:predicted nucleotidyltransferase